MVRWAPIICLAIGVSLLAPSMSACAPSATGESNSTVTPAVALTDFSALVPPDKPNNWLVAPSDFSGAAPPDEIAPVLNVPADELADAWRATIESEPRTAILATSEDGLRLEAEHESAVFGFIDRISIQVVPLDADRSTFAAYSTSLVGYWDLGANRGRLRDWIADVRQTAAGAAGSR